MKICLLLICTTVISCGSFKPVQHSNVEAFASATKMVSAAPKKLFFGIADYRHQLKMIQASTMQQPADLMEQLEKVSQMNQLFQQNAKDITLTMDLLNAYSLSLMRLSGKSHQKEWATESTEMGLQLTTAFEAYNKNIGKGLPPSVGLFVSRMVTKMGSMKLQSLQKKYLKSFVNNGSLIVADVCTYFSTTTALMLENELKDLQNQTNAIMSNFYLNIYVSYNGQNINPFPYLKEYNTFYVEMKTRLNSLQALHRRTTESLVQVKEAHQELHQAVNASAKTPLLPAVKELYASALSLKTWMKELKDTKTNTSSDEEEN